MILVGKLERVLVGAEAAGGCGGVAQIPPTRSVFLWIAPDRIELPVQAKTAAEGSHLSRLLFEPLRIGLCHPAWCLRATCSPCPARCRSQRSKPSKRRRCLCTSPMCTACREPRASRATYNRCSVAHSTKRYQQPECGQQLDSGASRRRQAGRQALRRALSVGALQVRAPADLRITVLGTSWSPRCDGMPCAGRGRRYLAEVCRCRRAGRAPLKAN